MFLIFLLINVMHLEAVFTQNEVNPLSHAELAMILRKAVTTMEQNLLKEHGETVFLAIKKSFPKIFHLESGQGVSDVSNQSPLSYRGSVVSNQSVLSYPNPNNLIPCSAPVGWGNLTRGNFPSYKDAIAMGAGDVPNLGPGVLAPRHVPKMKKVIVIGKGESSRPIEKTDDVIIVTVNQALAWQNYSDIHFGADYYFHTVHLDFLCRARALVLPTYFHVPPGNTHVHISVFLSKLVFSGPIFLFQLPDGPKDPNVEMWDFPNNIHTSGDLAIAWMLRRGYRVFETYGIGSGTGYADYYVSETYKQPTTFVQNQQRHSDHIAKRIALYGGTWIRH